MPDDDFVARLDALGDDEAPILDPPDEGDDERPTSPLDDLLAGLTAEVEVDTEPLKLKVKGRPGYVAVFNRDIPAPTLQKWERQATSTKRGRDIIDPVKFNGLILTNTNVGIEHNGELAINPDTNEPLTFRDKWFIGIYAAASSIEATRAFYGRDAFFMAAADAVASGTGYGDEAEEVEAADPT